jgi:hypothetical protein
MENLSIIYGTLLGDAYIQKLSPQGKTRDLRYTHSTKQKEYSLYKAVEIKLPFSYVERNRYDKRTTKTYSSIEIRHKSNHIFNDIHDMFYDGTKKIITEHMLNLLTPESIAIWYCDDGNLYQNPKQYTNHLSFATNCFSNNELNLMKEYFNSKWNIDFSITSQNTLRIAKISQIRQFMELFGNYIPDCMRYKKL